MKVIFNAKDISVNVFNKKKTIINGLLPLTFNDLRFTFEWKR